MSAPLAPAAEARLAPAAEAQLEVRDLTLSYDGIRALHGVSFTVGAGEIYWAVTLHHFLEEHRSAVDAATFGCEAAARMVELSAPYAPTTIQDLREVIAPNRGAVVPVVEMPWSPYEVALDLPGQPSDWAI